jgi:hypothetical protein
MWRVAILMMAGVACATLGAHAQAPAAAPATGQVVVLETVKGIIEFETYPDTAPKAVARKIVVTDRLVRASVRPPKT